MTTRLCHTYFCQQMSKRRVYAPGKFPLEVQPNECPVKPSWHQRKTTALVLILVLIPIPKIAQQQQGIIRP
jgi:hypothetical protein